jgi:hypothetical protein
LAVKGQKELFTEGFKNLLAEHTNQAILESFEDEVAEGIPEENVDESDDTIDVLNQIDAFAKECGGHIVDYQEGVLDVCIHSGLQAKQFASFLDNFMPVDDYDCYEVINYDDSPDDKPQVEIDHDTYTDWDQIKIDSPLEFQFIVYLEDELVDGDDVLVDIEDTFTPDEETVGEVFEVMKIVKINFRGKKIIRMKCQKGYKYDVHQHTCVKREEHDIFLRQRKLQLNMLRRVASKAAIKKKINHKSLRFLLNRKRLGIGY